MLHEAGQGLGTNVKKCENTPQIPAVTQQAMTNPAVSKLLHEGGVIAYPTEGVWGLGCDPFQETAVMRILALKIRPVEKGLILIAGSLEQVGALIDDLDPAYRALLEDSWPGPNTWLLPDKNDIIPRWIKGDFSTVAVRVTDHPVAASLCNDFGGMLVSTSANPADLPPATTLEEVQAYFPEGVDQIIAGALGGQEGPSTIRDLMSQQVLR